MNNLEYLLTSTDIPSYTEEEFYAIIQKECELLGNDISLTICMEELAELIEVLMEYNIRGRLDKLHLKEEINDCYISILRLQSVFNISPENICMDKNIYTNNIVDNCVLNLTTAITKISKCIRKKVNAEIKALSIINLIQESLVNINHHFNIKLDELKPILYLKVKRSEERNITMSEQTNINLLDKLANAVRCETFNTYDEAYEYMINNKLSYNGEMVRVISNDKSGYDDIYIIKDKYAKPPLLDWVGRISKDDN